VVDGPDENGSAPELTAVEQQLEQIAREISRQFDRREACIEAGFNEIVRRFDGVYRRLDRLEQEALVIAEGMRRIEAAARRL
jgi:hypothetical protein